MRRFVEGLRCFSLAESLGGVESLIAHPETMTHAGMDPVAMKRGWGDRLCFEGGVSVQTTLPFGTVDDVRAEVRERIAVLGAGGGYILGPSHWIQAGTPAGSPM